MPGSVGLRGWSKAVSRSATVRWASLGLPASLESRGVFDAFVDVRQLQDAV